MPITDPPTSEEGTRGSVIEKLKLLKNKRAYFKRSLTILQQYLDSSANTPDYLGKVLGQFTVCQRSMTTCDEYLESIYDADNETQFNDAFNEKSNTDTIFFDLNARVDLLTVQPAHASPALTMGLPLSSIKLPRADLPTFSGNFRDWLTFRERFSSLIDSNKSLADIEKMQYLISALKDEASDAVKHLEITSANYQKAKDLLKERFENIRVIVTNHIRALVELAPATKESYSGFRAILNAVTQHTHALKVMGRNVDQADLLIYLITSKLPFHTRKEWEEKIPSTQLPTYQDIIDFLTHKCHTLEALNLNEGQKTTKPNNTKFVSLHANAGKSLNCCKVCNSSNHFTNQCPDLLNISVNARIERARSKRLCLNCLRHGHLAKDCKSSRCKKCNRQHNTILHIENTIRHDIDNSSGAQENSLPSASLKVLVDNQEPSNVLLSTCIVEIRDAQGNYRDARAMLDSGSQINVISKELAQSLQLEIKQANLPIAGIDNGWTTSKTVLNANVRSKYMEFSTDLRFYILNKVSTNIPAKDIDASSVVIPRNVHLADPQYYKTRRIDLIIGAQVFFQLLCVGQIRTSHPGLIFQKSVFGWLISGTISNKPIPNSTPVSCHLNVLQKLNDNIAKFWEIENVSEPILSSIEEAECEKHFTRTIKRDATGRFIASLPWKSDPKLLGDSLDIAKKRFLNLERKLLRNPNAKIEYDAFMREYLELGHMAQVGTVEEADQSGYFLPHHAVYKLDSSTTRIRVVFDASSKTSNNQSLNDILMLGPVIQDDLFSILIRFRLHKYILSADISKMYRQILIDSQDTCYQKILYRFTANGPIMIYELKTLTYGTRPASFIATRCLKELSVQGEDTSCLFSKTIARDFYMDDLITGGDDAHELILLRDQLIEKLKAAGFLLRKWISNNKDILNGLDSRESHLIINCKGSESLKTLGISWSPVPDTLEYKSHLAESSRTTKRTILSSIAQIFDPLGLLGPVLVIAKTIMQELWKLKLSWDASVPLEIFTRWKQFTNELEHISQLSIPRKLINFGNSRVEIHGFSDASERAYGACVYLREIASNQPILCRLICSKSRIAPLQTQSIPRLELCAALLLTELVRKVVSAINNNEKYEIANITYYSDSTITLCWIQSCPSRWKSFVATRVSKIQRISNADSWCHVATHENPADIVSRGCFLEPLAVNSLWWNGPDFLTKRDFTPMSFKENPEQLAPEAKVLIVQTHESDQAEKFVKEMFSKYSDFTRLIRIIALCMRFRTYRRNGVSPCSREVSEKEFERAEITCIKMVQNIAFSSEIKLLVKSKQVPKGSKILALSPFLDENLVIRVGGRLRNSELVYDAKHPMLLPKGKFCELLIRDAHVKSLHSGMQGTLAAVRLKYWPVAGRNAVRKIIRSCVTCFRHKPRINKHKMADLPESRLKITRTFSRVGIDFFGPFLVKEGSRKTRRTTKAYGCVFVCMLTKAVHCELVEDLSTDAFLAALKRFISRRGLPAEIFCDNATNFLGAANSMREIIQFLCDSETQREVSGELVSRGIAWRFNVPRAPHMGGLWEAAVKALKGHAYKVLGNAQLTFIEMYTLFTEIECILNSRPITPLSSDPNDLTYLTPGHFLVGDYLRSVAEIDLRAERLNRLSRWQYVQRLQQEFWQRWRRDYLQQLQTRQKWRRSEGPGLQMGDLVLIHEDNIPSRSWPMGRVLEVHPGADGVVRVATVKTVRGVYKRPSVRLSVLPIEA